MSEQSVATSIAPEVIIEQVLGELQVKGWDRPEVSIKANPDELTFNEQDDVVRLSCRGNCSIRLPHAATILVESVHGGARFKLLEDQLTIEQVLGSLALRNVAEIRVEAVHGELSARQVAGDLHAGQVFGNAELRNVQGKCILEEVSGNLDVRNVEGEIKASTQGNARLSLEVLTGGAYEVHAGGNIHAHIPEDANLEVTLSSEAEMIQVFLPGESKSYQQESYELTLGGGDASMSLSAGGTILLSSQPAGWRDAEEPETDFLEGFRISGEFNQKIAEQVASQIEAQMEAMTRQLNEQMANLSSVVGKAGLSEEQAEEIMERARETSERATARAQEKMRRAQEKLERKLEAARRRNEMKAQAAERRAQARGRRSWSFEWPSAPPPPQKEPVSDEERLLILRMLEQKKITLEEAEQLLAALEGREE